jgi:hypothetical protein
MRSYVLKAYAIVQPLQSYSFAFTSFAILDIINGRTWGFAGSLSSQIVLNYICIDTNLSNSQETVYLHPRAKVFGKACFQIDELYLLVKTNQVARAEMCNLNELYLLHMNFDVVAQFIKITPARRFQAHKKRAVVKRASCTLWHPLAPLQFSQEPRRGSVPVLLTNKKIQH